MEGSDAPEIEEPIPELDAKVSRWTKAQNAYTRGVLDNLSGRRSLEERLHELLRVGSVRAPDVSGNRYFNLERQGDESQPVLYVRQGHDGEPRRLLDPNQLDAKGLTDEAKACVLRCGFDRPITKEGEEDLTVCEELCYESYENKLSEVLAKLSSTYFDVYFEKP